MSESKKDDGVQKLQLRIANKKGYVIVITAITMLFGGPIVDVVVTSSNPDVSRDSLINRVDDLEDTVKVLEHKSLILKNQALMCSPRYAIKDEDPFEDIWP